MRLDDATGQVRMTSQLDNITVDARGLVQHFEALRCFFGELLGDVVSHAVLSCPSSIRFCLSQVARNASNAHNQNQMVAARAVHQQCSQYSSGQ